MKLVPRGMFAKSVFLLGSPQKMLLKNNCGGKTRTIKIRVSLHESAISLYCTEKHSYNPKYTLNHSQNIFQYNHFHVSKVYLGIFKKILTTGLIEISMIVSKLSYMSTIQNTLDGWIIICQSNGSSNKWLCKCFFCAIVDRIPVMSQ